MNANLIFVLGLVMMAIALIIFIITVLFLLNPAKCEKGVLFRGWLVTDEDGDSYVCRNLPSRQNWTDSNGQSHGVWYDDEVSFLSLGDVFSREELAQVEGLPTWDDEPVRVELVLSRDINDGLVPSEMMEDEQPYEF